MATTFRPHPNNVSTALASNYTAGSGSLVLASGTGAAFGSTFPLTVTVAQAANVGLTTEVNTIFTVTGRSSDTLTGVSATEGTTDRAYAIGDRVECRWTGGNASAIETAVNGCENATGITAGVIAPARLGSGTPGATNFLRGDGQWLGPYQPVNISANYTAVAADSLIVINSSSNAVTVTLPPAASSTGREYLFFAAIFSSAIVIQRAGTDTILGFGNTMSITAAAKYIRLVSGGGGAWYVLGQN